MKKTILLLIAIITSAGLPASAQTVSTTGSLHLDGKDTLSMYGLSAPPHALPEIALSTLPSDVAQSWGTSVSSTPSSDVVMTCLEGLRGFAQGSNPVGVAWWGFVVTLASAGMVVSFFFVARAVSQREAEPSEFITWIIRSAASVFVISYLAGASPWVIITGVNYVTDSLSGSTADVIAKVQQNTTSNYFAAILAERIRMAATSVATTSTTSPAAATAAEPALMKEAAQVVSTAIDGATTIDQRTFIKAENALSGWVYQEYGLLGADGTTDLTLNGAASKNYEAVQQALSGVPKDYQDSATSAWKSLNTALYTFAVEIALTIWTLPISFGLWGAFLAWPQAAGLPKFWSLALKAFITLILSCALASTFAFTALQTVAGTPQQNQGGYWSYLSSQMGRISNGDVVGAGEATASEAVSLLASVTGGQWMQFMSGTFWQMVIVTCLIATSPGMAVIAVAGGNWASSAIKGVKDNPSGGSSWGGWTGGHGNWDPGAGGAGSRPTKSRRDMLE